MLHNPDNFNDRLPKQKLKNIMRCEINVMQD